MATAQSWRKSKDSLPEKAPPPSSSGTVHYVCNFQHQCRLSTPGQATGVPVDERFAGLLGDKTEGWIPGLRLATLSLRGGQGVDRLTAGEPVYHRVFA